MGRAVTDNPFSLDGKVALVTGDICGVSKRGATSADDYVLEGDAPYLMQPGHPTRSLCV